MIARLTVVLCVVLLALPAAAAGQAFDPLPPPQPQTPQTVVEEANADEDEGMSATQQLLIGLAGFGMLAGIAWLIMRDARAAAPAASRDVAGDTPQPKGSQKPAGARHRQSRSKAKAARQARKRARKR